MKVTKVQTMYTRKDIITEQRLDSLRRIRNEKRRQRFDRLIPLMGEAAVAEVEELYRMFDERMLIWYAGLWEPDIGGFYFSNSARDHEGFLPDLESTNQAIGFITTQCDILPEGAMPITAIPSRFAEKICAFAYEKQDEDGYFYHPQWGKSIPATRRGRDLMAAWRLIEPLGKECRYLRPGKGPKTSAPAPTVPEYLHSTEAFASWLDGQNIETRSYQFGHYINSTCGQIIARGEEYVRVLVDWLNAHQFPENGLWEPTVNYNSVSGLMKLGMCYPDLKATLPYPEKSFESARAALLSDEPVTFSCEFYNAWAAMQASLRSMELSGNDALAEKYRERLRKEAPRMIRTTGEKIAACAVDDGSFAYFTASSGKVCHTSQGVTVARDDVREGDINGNGCSTKAPLTHMFNAFGVSMPPMFTPEDAELLFELMDARVAVEKQPLPKKSN